MCSSYRASCTALQATSPSVHPPKLGWMFRIPQTLVQIAYARVHSVQSVSQRSIAGHLDE
jgi:hypothetical protein